MRVVYDPKTGFYENIIQYLVKNDFSKELEAFLAPSNACYISNSNKVSPMSLM
jgi:hypothetical protein